MCLLPPSAAAAPRLLRRALAAAMSAAAQLKSVDYEVFGRVQGVCFRMYTEGEAKKIGVVGWVKNTSKGTVTGQVQGPEEKVNSISPEFKLYRRLLLWSECLCCSCVEATSQMMLVLRGRAFGKR
ncbi:acylphosphatase-2 isoform X2 [Cavia porcellus]|uniref:acylphosphatase-2 isoform X2 n=1 Tax=Cavia porcellus TaxID=10141 RepID=UPI002FE0DF52